MISCAPGPRVRPGHAASKNKGKAGDATTDRLLGTVISAVERALIGDYVKNTRVSVPGLPPGLRKHIERTGRLPPGLEKRRLPGDLRALLPLRSGQDYRVVGDDIMLIEIATELILDVMKDVLR